MASPGTDFDVSFWRDVQAGPQASGALRHVQACAVPMPCASIRRGL